MLAMDYGLVDLAAITALGAAFKAYLDYKQKMSADQIQALRDQQDRNHVETKTAVDGVEKKLEAAASETKAAVASIDRKVEKVSKDVDGLSSKREAELTAAKVDLGTALGTAQGRAEQKAEAKADDLEKKGNGN
jgi:hypothetical protein